MSILHFPTRKILEERKVTRFDDVVHKAVEAIVKNAQVDLDKEPSLVRLTKRLDRRPL